MEKPSIQVRIEGGNRTAIVLPTSVQVNLHNEAAQSLDVEIVPHLLGEPFPSEVYLTLQFGDDRIVVFCGEERECDRILKRISTAISVAHDRLDGLMGRPKPGVYFP